MRPQTWPLLLVMTPAVVIGQWGDDSTREVERRIRKWDPVAEDRYQPPACLRPKAFDLEGQWTLSVHGASNALLFEAKQGNGFHVEFTARWQGLDDSEHWTLKRRAQVKGGAIILDRAIADHNAIYSTMWALEVGPHRVVALVSSADLPEVRRAFKAGGCDYFTSVFECRNCYTRQAGRRDPR